MPKALLPIEEVDATAATRLRNSTIGFVWLSTIDDVRAQLRGSGTLIAIGTRRGILTADHVYRSIEKDPLIGLWQPYWREGRGPQQMLIEPAYLRAYALPRGQRNVDPPDICFLALPPSEVARIEARGGVFHDLQKRARFASMSTFDIGEGAWYLAGAAEEDTTDRVPLPKGFEVFKDFLGVIEWGMPRAHRMWRESDFITIPMPLRNYGGYSGGGLWQVKLKLDAGTGQLVPVEYILAGVAFRQSRPPRVVRCNGPKTIYEQLLPSVLNT